MAELITPVEIQPLEVATLPPATGAEAYFCGDQGWRSTCFRELGETVGLGAFGGLLLNASYNSIASGAEGNINTTGAAVATTLGVLGCGALGFMRARMARRRDARPAPADTSSTFETHKHYYAMLAGRVALPEEQ